MAPGIPGFAKEVSMNSWLTWGYWYMFLLLKELLQPDGLPAPTHPLGRGVFNETPSLMMMMIWWFDDNFADILLLAQCRRRNHLQSESIFWSWTFYRFRDGAPGSGWVSLYKGIRLMKLGMVPQGVDGWRLQGHSTDEVRDGAPGSGWVASARAFDWWS